MLLLQTFCIWCWPWTVQSSTDIFFLSCSKMILCLSMNWFFFFHVMISFSSVIWCDIFLIFFFSEKPETCPLPKTKIRHFSRLCVPSVLALPTYSIKFPSVYSNIYSYTSEKILNISNFLARHLVQAGSFLSGLLLKYFKPALVIFWPFPTQSLHITFPSSHYTPIFTLHSHSSLSFFFFNNSHLSESGSHRQNDQIEIFPWASIQLFRNIFHKRVQFLFISQSCIVHPSLSFFLEFLSTKKYSYTKWL